MSNQDALSIVLANLTEEELIRLGHRLQKKQPNDPGQKEIAEARLVLLARLNLELERRSWHEFSAFHDGLRF